MKAEEKYKIVEKYYGGNKKHILDIGCKDGSFLICAKENGWEITVGLEPKKELYKKAIIMLPECYHGRFPDAELSFEKYNVITCWDILNKIKDPVSFIKKVRSLMFDNSMFFLKVLKSKNKKFEYIYSKEGLMLLFSKAKLRYKIVEEEKGLIIIGEK